MSWCNRTLISALLILQSTAGFAIYGGSTASGSYSYIVAIFNSSNTFLCGGSLISSQYVLTAASCVSAYQSSPGSLQLSIGDLTPYSTSSYSEVSNVYINSNYNSSSHRYNLALLKLTDEVDNTPVDLASLGSTTGKSVQVLGWGETTSSVMPTALLIATLETTANENCTSGVTYESSIMICADDPSANGTSNKIATCTGDTGGPLIYGGDLVGVGDFIEPDDSGYSCGDADYWSIFTKISGDGVTDWIDGYIDDSDSSVSVSSSGGSVQPWLAMWLLPLLWLFRRRG